MKNNNELVQKYMKNNNDLVQKYMKNNNELVQEYTKNYYKTVQEYMKNNNKTVQEYAKKNNEPYDGYQRSYDMNMLLSGTHDKYNIGKVLKFSSIFQSLKRLGRGVGWMLRGVLRMSTLNI